VDHNICTIDGRGSFQEMGIIAVSTKTAEHSEALRSTEVMHLARKPVPDVIVNMEILILTHASERNGLSNSMFAKFSDLLMRSALLVSTNSDLLWSTGWLFPDAARPKTKLVWFHAAGQYRIAFCSV